MTKEARKRSLIFVVYVFLSGFIFPNFGYGGSDRALRPQDVRENIYSSAILSPTEYLMVGGRGKIFRSPDKGEIWHEVFSGTRLALYSVTFPDANNGWISGQSGLILHTTDGGVTWTKQESGKDKHLFSIDFADDRHGCAVGDWGVIVITDDGGTTWQDFSYKEDVVFYGVGFADSQSGWIVGEFGQIFSTLDGGRTWSPVQLPLPVDLSLFCLDIDGDSLYAAGLDGIIIYSRDRGETWHRGRSASNNALYSIVARGDSGWAAGNAGTVLQTADGGETWQMMDIPEQNKLFWVGTLSLSNSKPGKTYGFGAGARGLFFTIKQYHLSWEGERRRL